MKPKEFIDDETLLMQSIDGSELAFTQLYKRYNKKIYSFAFKILRSEELAEEVMHETMLKVWDLGEKGKEIKSFEAYVKVSAKNKSLNVLRKLELDWRTQALGTVDWNETHEDTEETILLNDVKKLLDEAISLLPPQQQKVFKLCHVEGLKYEEAASLLGLSPQTVGTHMKLALKFVRAYIQQASGIFAILLIFR